MPPDDDTIKDPFDGLLAAPRKAVFKAVGVGNTKGHELIKDGTFEVLNLGRRSRPILVESVRRAIRNGRIANKVA